jgi:hypothetical protein
LFFTVFTAAEKHLARFCGFIFHGLERRVSMRAITKGLFGAFAAGTPKIGFTSFDIDAVWGFLGNNGCAHGRTLVFMGLFKG